MHPKSNSRTTAYYCALSAAYYYYYYYLSFGSSSSSSSSNNMTKLGCSAFSAIRVSNHHRRSFSAVVTTVANNRNRQHEYFDRQTLRQQQRPALYMAKTKNNWWQSFVGGGAYNLPIDYDALPFPAPELAAAAKEGLSIPSLSPSQPHLEVATFGGGCFWGLELAFQRTTGVEYTVVGYTQGREPCPNYEHVVAGNTGHAEAVCVYFDPTAIPYQELLLNVFLNRIDPTTANGQGKDFGKQYRTGIYYHSESQKTLAQAALGKEQAKYQRAIATECRAAVSFWPAEEYHQQYLTKGGRFGSPQSPEKNCTDEIRCYG
jgi:peptide-methionine (S)-S-oxide reductase